MSDAAGAVVEKYTYSAYGESGNEGDAGFPFRFTGQKLDAETGLYYYKARYYDPETGRFMQTDPIGYRDQMNLYAYCNSDPISCKDPTGEFGFIDAVFGAISGAVGGFTATGTIGGAAAGLVGGAVAGFVSPDPFTATVLGSVVGQVAGQAYDNFENGRPIAADIAIDGPTTVGAAAGAIVGGPVAKLALRVAPVTEGAVIGSELGAETVGRVPGKTAASGLEGFFAGAGEAIGAKVSDALGFEGVPNTLQITDSEGNLDIQIQSRVCGADEQC